ncbi:hypothetical protein PAXRUDRAFT_145762 [Paxillus rubicundulus Ve08.2h10]|uniref:SWIM-type domain-containing protein n=1 Tax=Paxillus rubicundulus Ve08.2h10 TaxID=930991 RepID=A0A0D0DUZ1_9AGAM|nr:hypothetical protein PAXRUDRAFT_145762 [Paxillus rubicundulus Ve08.2h10]
MWSLWYSPSRWLLWACSMTDYVSHLHMTMDADNHFKQLKHHHLHHLLCLLRSKSSGLSGLIWILCTKVTPGYIHRAGILEDTYCLSLFQMKFKRAWRTLADTPTSTSNHSYTVDVSTWTCNCSSQKYNMFHLCKHLVQAISIPLPSFLDRLSDDEHCHFTTTLHFKFPCLQTSQC